MELTFAVAAVIAAAGLLFGLDVAERRRGFAVLALLGAKRNEIAAAFLWSEALVVVGPGLAAFAARAPSQKRSGGLGSRCVPDCTRRMQVMGDDDYSGLAVHIGARVAALAGPGEVLVSSTVKDPSGRFWAAFRRPWKQVSLKACLASGASSRVVQ